MRKREEIMAENIEQSTAKTPQQATKSNGGNSRLLIGLIVVAVAVIAVMGWMLAGNNIVGKSDVDFNQVASTCGSEKGGDDIFATSSSLDIEYTSSGLIGPDENSAAFSCVMSELDAPDSLLNKMSNTRPIDGMQSDSWNGLKATWTYTASDGRSGTLSVTFEKE